MDSVRTVLGDHTSDRLVRAGEMKAARAWLLSQGFLLDQLERRSLPVYLGALGLVWAGIVLALVTALTGELVAVFVSIVVIGYLQRALGNLLHDFAHGGFRNRQSADFVATLFSALPMMTTLDGYRANHFAHHRYLGDSLRDPDFIHSPERLSLGTTHALINYLVSPKVWLDSLSGQLPGSSGKQRLLIGIWWLTAGTTVSLLLGHTIAIAIAALWFSARATSFHLLTSFREMADHVGLKPGHILSFTRNSPQHGLLRHLIHPFNNGLHIAHHLFPQIPFYNLRRAHRALATWQPYAEAENCPSYFFRAPTDGSALPVYSSLSICYRALAIETGAHPKVLKEQDDGRTRSICSAERHVPESR